MERRATAEGGRMDGNGKPFLTLKWLLDLFIFMHYIIEDYLSAALVANQMQNGILDVRCQLGNRCQLFIVIDVDLLLCCELFCN